MQHRWCCNRNGYPCVPYGHVSHHRWSLRIYRQIFSQHGCLIRKWSALTVEQPSLRNGSAIFLEPLLKWYGLCKHMFWIQYQLPHPLRFRVPLINGSVQELPYLDVYRWSELLRTHLICVNRRLLQVSHRWSVLLHCLPWSTAGKHGGYVPYHQNHPDIRIM